MNKLEKAFQEMEEMKEKELGNVRGGIVSIELYKSDDKKEDKDKPVVNTGWFCGITINICSK